jgi:GNAT superfamily N-acetyltransferase
MALSYPNIVPPNDLRLPDALTIKHGPRELLARFALEADKAGRRLGLRFRLRHDFANFAIFNEFEVARGNWYPLLDIFNPALGQVSAENSYWISGETEDGEIVVTQSGRVFHWPDTTLAQEAGAMFYGGRADAGRCILSPTAEAAASRIGGLVFFGGAVWVRSDFRRNGLSRLMARIGRAYAAARWPLDWGISLVKPDLVDKGVARGYGYKHISGSLYFPDHLLKELQLVYLSMPEAYQDLGDFLAGGLGGLLPASSPPVRTTDPTVTRTSPDAVVHGSSSLS